MSSAPQASLTDAPARPAARPWLVPVLVCGAVFLVYAGTFSFGFVYDDKPQVLSNLWITSYTYIPRYFTSHVWAFANIAGAYWRPLFLLWLLFNHTLFGLNPTGWHVTNVLLHVATTGFVYLLAKRLTRDRAAGAIAALIFGLHPALIESVAWISGVTDALVAVCLVPSFLAFLKWHEDRACPHLPNSSADGAPATGVRRQRPGTWLAASLILYALALMSKEPAVVLPVLVFSYGWIYAEPGVLRRARGAFDAVLPYVPVTLLYAAIHWIIWTRVSYARTTATPYRTLLTVPSLLLFYMRALVWPATVSPHYDFAMVTAFSFVAVIVPLLVLAAVGVAIFLWTRRDRHLARLAALAGAWVLFPILPALYIAPQGAHDFAHVRYLYLSCVGLGIFVAAAIRRLGRIHWQIGPVRFLSIEARARQTLVATGIILLLAAGTFTQQIYWASNLLLFTRGVKVAPNSPTALTGLGVEYGILKKYPEAIALFQRALAIDAGDWHPNFSLGYTYYVLGRYAEAEPLLERAVTINTFGSDPDQFAYLSLVESKLGNLPKAEHAMRLALQRDPRSRFHYPLGLILEQEGRFADAAQEYRTELQLNPGNADARRRLAGIEHP
ncbi:MAG: tetratricopeptide repeat protein [Terriglobales bacterium]